MNRPIVSMAAWILIPNVALAQTRVPAAPPVPRAPAAQAIPPPPAPPAPPAQTAPRSLSESLLGPAKADYDAAKLLYGDRDYRGALVKFEAAFAASKDPRLLWNMAACEKELRHYAKAVADINRYVVESGAMLSEQDRAEATAKRDTLQAFVSPVAVRVSEPDADVLLDGEVVGRSPLGAPIVADIGERTFTVRKAGFREFVQTVQVSGPASLDVQLLPEKHEGRLEVRAPEGAQIRIDGQLMGVGSWSGTLASGTHALSVTAPHTRAYQSEVAIRDADTRTLSVMLEPDERGGIPAWVWVTGGVVVVGGAATAGYFLLKKSPATETGTLSPGTVQIQVFK